MYKHLKQKGILRCIFCQTSTVSSVFLIIGIVSVVVWVRVVLKRSVFVMVPQQVIFRVVVRVSNLMAQVVRTSVTKNSSFQSYPQTEDHIIRTTEYSWAQTIFYNYYSSVSFLFFHYIVEPGYF